MLTRYLCKNDQGFAAVITVVLVFLVTFTLAVTVYSAVKAFDDDMYLHEWRIQAAFDQSACLYEVALMVSRDYFLRGLVALTEFGCEASVTQYASHILDVATVVKVGTVKLVGGERLLLNNHEVTVVF